MANCCYSFMGCVSSMLLTLMKVILMTSCIFILLAELAGLWGLYYVDQDLEELNFPCVEIRFYDYLGVIGLIVLSLIGIHGVYTNDSKYLKIFALVLSGYAVSHIVFMNYNSLKENWNKDSGKFQDLMSNYAEEYQWNQEPGEKLNKGTRAWDMVQGKLLCCGLSGPADWPQKWKTSKKNILPKSCCLKLSRAINQYHWMDDKCELGNAYKVGCMERITEVVDSSSRHAFIFAIFSLILACMALIIAKHSELNQLSCAATNASPQYQRFDGSVYVRQPAAHQVSFGKQPPVAPTLYPNANGVEHGDAPPKYGN